MKRLAFLIAILFSCHDSSMDMKIVHGIPTGVTIRCAEFSDGAAGCVGDDGKSYACVSSGGCGDPDRYDCAQSDAFHTTSHETTTVYVSQ